MTTDAGSRTIELGQNSRAIRRLIRVRKEDSAFVYSVFEASEGICSYSTLNHRPGEAHRDLELIIPIDFRQEVDAVIQQLGEMVYELDTESKP